MNIDNFYKYKNIYKEFPCQLNSHFEGIKYLKNKSKKHWKKQINLNWILKKSINENNEQKIKSQLTEILNKISETNFKEMSEMILNTNITKKNHLELLSNLIIEKAENEKNFNDIYVKLCSEIFNIFINDEDEKLYFRNILINECYKKFQKLVNSNSEEEIKQEFINNFVVGNFLDFIGGLYNENLINDAIAYSCLGNLSIKIIKKHFNSVNYLCVFFNKIKEKLKKQNNNYYQEIFNYMKQLSESKDNLLKNKDKFQILDSLGL